MLCVRTVTYKVTINGHHSRTITLSQGLWQGDTLSPYLCILCGEALAKCLYHFSVSKRHFFPAVRPGAERIPLLQFANDTMIFIRTQKPATKTVATLLSQYGTEARAVHEPVEICSLLQLRDLTRGDQAG